MRAVHSCDPFGMHRVSAHVTHGACVTGRHPTYTPGKQTKLIGSFAFVICFNITPVMVYGSNQKCSTRSVKPEVPHQQYPIYYYKYHIIHTTWYIMVNDPTTPVQKACWTIWE